MPKTLIDTNNLNDVASASAARANIGAADATAVAALTNNRQILTDAATIAWDFSIGNVAYVAIGANRTLSITNVTGVQFGVLEVYHNVAGTTITLPGDSDNVAWATAINKTTLLSFYYNGTSYIWSSNIGGGTGTAADTTAPILASALVNDNLPTRIILTFNETLLSSAFVASDFTTSPSKTISQVTVSGTKIYIDVTTAFLATDTITVTGGNGKIKDTAGNTTTNLSAQAVIYRNKIAVTSWGAPTGATISSNTVTQSATTAYGAANVRIASTDDGYVEFTATSATNTMVLALDPGAVAETGVAGLSHGVYIIGGVPKYVLSGTSNNLGVTPIANDVYRLEASGTNIIIKRSTDGGVTYATLGTYTRAAGDLYIKFVGNNAGAGTLLSNVNGFNLT